MSDKWVQHISGQGSKYRVIKSDNNLWGCDKNMPTHEYYNMYLPKSEYILCDPPEAWEDVTEQCNMTGTDSLWPHDEQNGEGIQNERDHVLYEPTHWVKGCYRLRKVGVEWFSGVALGETRKGYAFIVERKRP